MSKSRKEKRCTSTPSCSSTALRDQRAKAKELEEKKKKNIWYETVFPAKHATLMVEVRRKLGSTALSQLIKTMQDMSNSAAFKRWVTVPQLWESGPGVLHNFGALANLDNKFPNAPLRRVRCSPQLINFIEHRTAYVRPFAGPNPVNALTHLLRACFVSDHLMFIGPFSPYNLLCTSNLILDHAFIRAVIAASRWLGPNILPGGYMLTWPPPYAEEPL